ncbi:MAG: Fic family protein [Fimbriimonadaceae bacterium]
MGIPRASLMGQLHYLTVQDVLWVHLQATNKVEPYDYARLEEAVFYQYAYGHCTGLLTQASRFVTGFMRQHPFDAANEVTAFLACATFLQLNGQVLTVDIASAPAWIDRAKSGSVALEASVAEVSTNEHLGTRDTLRAVLDRYEGAFAAVGK